MLNFLISVACLIYIVRSLVRFLCLFLDFLDRIDERDRDALEKPPIATLAATEPATVEQNKESS